MRLALARTGVGASCLPGGLLQIDRLTESRRTCFRGRCSNRFRLEEVGRCCGALHRFEARWKASPRLKVQAVSSLRPRVDLWDEACGFSLNATGRRVRACLAFPLGVC